MLHHSLQSCLWDVPQVTLPDKGFEPYSHASSDIHCTCSLQLQCKDVFSWLQVHSQCRVRLLAPLSLNVRLPVGLYALRQGHTGLLSLLKDYTLLLEDGRQLLNSIELLICLSDHFAV